MSGMSGHVIICGFGRVGELIAKVGAPACSRAGCGLAGSEVRALVQSACGRARCKGGPFERGQSSPGVEWLWKWA